MSERKGTKGLELWCRKMTQGYPVKVENMTTSWRDGLAFCAIIHNFRPDLIEFEKLNKDDIYGNNELAFRIAEEKLGIPALLEPEDMVEYEVPDRLSILTYLSQFYQTFENQRGKSGARIAPKRPQSSPDHGIVSPASTSPPSKVQITLGKARKQPCAKCGFPVFIAERLNVGKLLYHRTCFRCARCNSQLTLANYYETENGEFCCEICPDEEKQISKKVSSEMVLRKSLSDEEKSASLHTYAETPDAYSTHFETALEFSLDRDLKKSSTLPGAENTEFSKARSHFFHSQMESSSESGSDDIPAELPKSKPPPLIKTQFLGEDIPVDTPNTKPPLLAKPDYIRIRDSDKKDMDKVSDSVSTEQTDDHFVTKDNAFSSNRVSVRARMKLFENNEDNINKSDINSFSSSHNSVPFSSVKKKPTVVAIDDLEDFDNISRNNSSIINVHSNNKQNDENVTVDEKTDYTTKESNLDLSGYETNNNIDKLKHDIDASLEKSSEKYSNGVVKTLDCSQRVETIYSSIESSHMELLDSSQDIEMIDCKNEAIKTSYIEILDSSQEAETDHNGKDIITSYIEILDSSQEAETTHSIKNNMETNQKVEVTQQRDISSEMANEEHHDNVIDISDTSQEAEIKKDILTIENSLEENCPELRFLAVSEDSFLTADSEISLKTISSDERPTYRRGYYTAYDYPAEDNNVNESIEQSFECVGLPKDNIVNVDTLEEKDENDDNESVTETDIDKVNVVEQDSAASEANEDITVVSNEDINTNNEINESEAQTKAPNDLLYNNESTINPSELEVKYLDDLHPFDDNIQSESTPPEPVRAAEEENLVISTNQLPPPRTKKKKIAITLEDSLLSTPDTPGFLDKVYVPRVSINPFGDYDDDEDDEDASYNPFEEDARKEEQEIISRKKISPRVEDMKGVKSYNPFEDDEDEELEPPVRPIPIPVPRTKAIRPEPKPRDTLSITSRGSHGGSNSSISSGSAVGSARKKKPAPRPPVPFQNNELLLMPGSSMASPSQSVTQSPNLSGTLRSRKNRRAPPPPNASTPTPQYLEENTPDNTVSCEVSPIVSERIERISYSEEKDVKDEVNRNRQSQIQNSQIETDSNIATDKSTAGRWKRRKGQAPSRPIPEKRIVKTLPLSEIKRELDTIEIQQQGLEKQGIRLEQIIREKCEGPGDIAAEDPVPIDVEDLILQLFELVNEKNELFRRQAELMYLRRQQRLEEEYADVEYQIRCLILQPDANKSDYDKVKEETLINRLVEIVERRNEIIDCLGMDRRRETEEDNSIRSQLNLYSSKRDDEKDSPNTEAETKKKKKHKKLNKIIHTFKHKKEKDRKVDVDKDVDETEVPEKGKKKKFTLF